MSIHAPRGRHETDKTLCNLRVSHAPERRRLADRPDEIDCDTCVLRLLRTWQATGLVDAAALPPDRWPWDGPV